GDDDSPKQGLGLGLTIAKHIVEQHHGYIAATSDGIGKGTTFEVNFPGIPVSRTLHLESDDNESHGIPPEDTALAASKILLVDDNPEALEMIGKALYRFGARVDSATNAQDAIKLMAENSYDLLVSDV